MGLINDVTRSQIPEILRRLRALENAAPMNNGAVGRGGFEVYDGGVINISNGGLNVTGTATISGTLNVGGTTALTGPFSQSGTSTFTGTTNLNGPTNIAGNFTATGTTNLNGPTNVAGNFTATGDTKLNGPTHINGNTDVTGSFTVNGAMRTTSTLSVEGVTSLKNDLNVTGGGKIKAGVTQINPDGTITLGPGLTLTPDNGSGTAAIQAGASQIQLTPSNPTYWAQFTGGAYFQGRVSAMDMTLASLQTTSAPANLYIDANGVVMRSTA